MANAFKGNVLRVDTSAAFTDLRNVRSVKYIGATSGTAAIRSDASASGAILWEESGDANVYNADVCLYDKSGIYVEVSNSAVVYIYLK